MSEHLETKRLVHDLDQIKEKVDLLSERIIRLEYDSSKIAEAVPQLKEAIKDLHESISGTGDLNTPGVAGHLRALVGSVQALEAESKNNERRYLKDKEEQARVNTEQRHLNLKFMAAVGAISLVGGGGGSYLVKILGG